MRPFLLFEFVTYAVFFECPSMKLQTMVTVLSENIVSMDAPKEVLTNVPYPTKGYTFAVRFGYVDKWILLLTDTF